MAHPSSMRSPPGRGSCPRRRRKRLPSWWRRASSTPTASRGCAPCCFPPIAAGFSGEQYAAPEAIALLREARRKPHDGHYVSLSGADPLNLVGILTPGARLPSLSGNRLLYRDGVPIALLAGGEVSFLEELPAPQQWEARNLLLRRQVPAQLAPLA